MDFTNAILNIRYNDEWLQLPAIKGTSAYISSSSTSREVPFKSYAYDPDVNENNYNGGADLFIFTDGAYSPAPPTFDSNLNYFRYYNYRTQWGEIVTLINDGPQQSVSSFTIWDGLDGSGAVNTVDNIQAQNFDIPLRAIRYVDQSLTSEEKNIARNNINALSTGFTINGISITNSNSATPTVLLTPANISAIHEGLKINGKSIINPSIDSASITLVPSDISAVHQALKINGKSITNPTQSSASITLVPSDVSAIHQALKINGKSITNPTQSNASIILTADDISGGVVPITRKINGSSLSNDITTRIIETNKIVPSASWSAVDSSELDYYADFNYRGVITVNGVTAAMIPQVIFGIEEGASGNFASIASTVTNAIYIYANSVPETDITIPTIICFT